jgi:hypothetical protein
MTKTLTSGDNDFFAVVDTGMMSFGDDAIPGCIAQYTLSDINGHCVYHTLMGEIVWFSEFRESRLCRQTLQASHNRVTSNGDVATLSSTGIIA